MQRVMDLIATRRILLLFVGGVGGVLFAASFAWACTSGVPDMKLSNKNAPDKGENFTYCSAEDYVSHNTGSGACSRDIEVHGTGFENTDGSSAGEVDLYWMDGPSFLTGVGWPTHVVEQLSGESCQALGKPLPNGQDVPVDSDSDGNGVNDEFVVDVTVPVGEAVYGGNGVCAVWQHNDHTPGLGNQYNIWPSA